MRHWLTSLARSAIITNILRVAYQYQPNGKYGNTTHTLQFISIVSNSD